MTEQLLSPRQTAERLGVSVPTVRRWINDGTLPAYKLGVQIRIKQSDINAMLEAARIQPAAVVAPALRARPAAASAGLRELLRAAPDG